MSAELNHTPDWVKNAVFYQIFPDRFAWSASVEKPGNFEPWESAPTPDGFKGGDLIGVQEKLDYLEDLGVDVIYFNPIFQATSNHRYNTHDYFQVDPLLGGNQAFTQLLTEAHKRNIRVVLDGVFNHVGRGFYQFNHILEVGPKSPYIDWFHIHRFPLNAYSNSANYDCWWGYPPMPQFNHANPQVRRFIFNVARHWLEHGADGWRLDVPFEIKDDEFWREFREVVKTANPEAYIVGEIPSEAQHWLAGDMFDGVMNYQLTHACVSFFGGNHIDAELAKGMMGLPTPEAMDAVKFAQRTQELLTIYPNEFAQAQLNLLDSHDMPRFLSLVREDIQRLYLAYLFTLTYPGAPCIYYGDEIGMTGGRDPDCRKAFPWDKSEWNQQLHDKIRELVLLRHAIPALRTGTYQPLLANGNLLVYMRQDEHDSVIVAINLESSSQTLDIELKELIPDGTVLQDQLGSTQVTIQSGKISSLTLPSMSAVILA